MRQRKYKTGVSDDWNESVMSMEFIIEHGVLKRYSGREAHVALPDGIHAVGYGAFRGNETLEAVYIPEGVTKIDSLAFAGCKNLCEVHLPDGLLEIGYSAFEQCGQLKQMTLPDGLFLLDRMAFLNCEALSEITFPDTLDSVGRDALRGTAWLNNQPEGVVYAGSLALFTKGSIAEADIRPGTKKICVDAFRNGTALTRVTLPESLKIIEDRAFQNCRRLTHLVIPESVEHIGYRAFDECIRLSAELNALNPVIGRQCFMDTANVRITAMDPGRLPDNVRQSAILAFAEDVYNGAELDEAFKKRFFRYIMSRRKLLYPLALDNGSLLQVLMQEEIIPLEDVDWILESVLEGEQTEAAAALMQYKQTISRTVSQNEIEDEPELFGDISLDGWDDFELSWDLPMPEKTAEDLAREWGMKKQSDDTYTLMLYRGSDLELTVPNRIGDKMITAISPSALSPARHGIKHETIEHRKQIRTVTIEEGITRIGNHAFADCENLTALMLPESLVEIGYEAFRSCTALTELILPQSIERIGREAFAGCVNLKTVRIPAHIKLAEDTFRGCENVTVE